MSYSIPNQPAMVSVWFLMKKPYKSSYKVRDALVLAMRELEDEGLIQKSSWGVGEPDFHAKELT